jgi:hypothetical protein
MARWKKKERFPGGCPAPDGYPQLKPFRAHGLPQFDNALPSKPPVSTLNFVKLAWRRVRPLEPHSALAMPLPLGQEWQIETELREI